MILVEKTASLHMGLAPRAGQGFFQKVRAQNSKTVAPCDQSTKMAAEVLWEAVSTKIMAPINLESAKERVKSGSLKVNSTCPMALGSSC
jgi:hypothetical protein